MSKPNRFSSSSSSNKGNSRFSVLNEPIVNSPKEPRTNALFSNRTNNNSRFESLKEEIIPVSDSISGSISNGISGSNSNRSYNSFKTIAPVNKPEPVIQQMNLKETDFPDLLSISSIKKEEASNKWAKKKL